MAIAARLGIDVPEIRQGGPRRAEAHRNDARKADARRDAGTSDTHAVVRTLARRLSGRVRQYNPERGYGFVVSPDAPDDVFFHRSDCRVDPTGLEPSAAVTFDLVEMANGQVKAVNLAARA